MDEMREEDVVMTERNKEFKELARDMAVPDAVVKLSGHTIHYESPAGNESPLPAAMCSCGWVKRHVRLKTVYLKALQHSRETGHIMLEKGP